MQDKITIQYNSVPTNQSLENAAKFKYFGTTVRAKVNSRRN